MSGDFGQMKCWPGEDVIVKAVEGMIILSDPLLSPQQSCNVGEW